MTGSASWISGYLGVVAVLVGFGQRFSRFLRLGDERLDFEVRWRLQFGLFGFGYAVEIGLCKAELRITGTRCPTFENQANKK